MSESDRKAYFKSLRHMGMLTWIPVVMVSAPLAGFFTGRWLVQHFKWNEIVTPVSAGLGLLAAVRESYRVIKQVSREM